MKSVLLAVAIGAAMCAPAFAQQDPACATLKVLTDSARETPPFGSLTSANAPTFEGAARPCARQADPQIPTPWWTCLLADISAPASAKPDEAAAFAQASEALTADAMNFAARVNLCLGPAWTSTDDEPTQTSDTDKDGVPRTTSLQAITWTSTDNARVRVGLGAMASSGLTSRWVSLSVSKL